MLLKFKRFSEQAVIPARANPTDAGFDLVATSQDALRDNVVRYRTDIGVAIPPGFVGILKERSSIRKKGVTLVGGVIDAGYTGPIEVSFMIQFHSELYRVGEKICQLVVVPLAQIEALEEVAEFEQTARGSNGFGSTGN